MANSKLTKKKQTRNPIQINIGDCSLDDEWIMEDKHKHNRALGLDVQLGF